MPFSEKAIHKSNFLKNFCFVWYLTVDGVDFTWLV